MILFIQHVIDRIMARFSPSTKFDTAVIDRRLQGGPRI